jgi:hypothetical protein
VVPVADTCQDEVLQERAAPIPSRVLPSSFPEGFSELLIVDFEGTRLQRERVFGLEEILSESGPQDPEGLADGVPTVMAICIGPEEIGQIVPGNRGIAASDVNEECQRLPEREGNRFTRAIQELRRAEDTELMWQKNLHLASSTSEVQSRPVPSFMRR